MFGLGAPEIIIILVIIIVLFGPKKLPEFAKGIGESMKEFRKASKEAAKADKEDEEEEKAAEVKAAKTTEAPEQRRLESSPTEAVTDTEKVDSKSA